MSKKTTTTTAAVKNIKVQGWKQNTALCVDLKTILRSERTMKIGKDYQGVLRRDVECEEYRYDEHYTFIETQPWLQKRNPRVFSGRYITITRKDDGSLRLNYRPLPALDGDFSIDSYAIGVCNELRKALTGLIEKS